MRPARPLPMLALLVAVLAALAWMRGLDHDESQYVAAARLVAGGLLPYRDFAYLQTPLQPILLAPVAWLAGDWAWPALRLVNALLGAVVVAASWRAMRIAGANEATATVCAALLATCDILLFSAGTARNDALPAALLALALVPMLEAERGQATRAGAALTGLLLAGAAAAKISYALPAAAYGLYALFDRRHRPGWVAIGALPPLALVAALGWAAPQNFVFGTLVFPATAPAEYYLAAGRPWKLSLAAKAIDTVKFLALGPALVALALVARRPKPGVPIVLLAAGLIGAVLPTPTWRQYLLPALPPLFVLLAVRWEQAPPARGWRIAFAVFALAGLVPTALALSGPAMFAARSETRGITALGLTAPVATLAPQFLPHDTPLDPRFAVGPFYFRSRGLMAHSEEERAHLVSRDRLAHAFAIRPPGAIVTGGEGAWTSGDARLDSLLADWARGQDWHAVPLGARRMTAWLPPQAAARRLPARRSE